MGNDDPKKEGSFIGLTQTKKEVAASQKAMAAFVKGMDERSNVDALRVLEDAAAEDSVQVLIREAEDLIRTLGLPLPQNAAESREAALRRTFPNGAPGSSGMGVLKALAVEFPRVAADPVICALNAYASLLTAKKRREAGDLGAALYSLADGAWFLAKACSASVAASNSHAREKGARSRHSNDPKQEAKLLARNLWEEREQGLHAGLRTDEQFAMEVMRRWPVLGSGATIVKWSSAWRREGRVKRIC